MKAKKSLGRRIFNIILTIVLVILVVVIALTMFIRISGNTPSFGGYMIFRVSTGSMEPELNIGDVILVKDVNVLEEVAVGDVITYEGRESSYAGKLITHEVIKAPYEENGKYYLVTKGIANPIEDPAITEDQVVGKMLMKIPLIGMLYNFFLTPWGLVITILLIVLAFSGEFWNIYKLSHNKTEMQKVDQDVLDKAIEQYKAENNSRDIIGDTQKSDVNNTHDTNKEQNQVTSDTDDEKTAQGVDEKSEVSHVENDNTNK